MKLRNQDILQRLITYAVETSSLVEELPKNAYAQYLGAQLMRSGTSPALNYAEACAAESVKDLLHKEKVVLKELRESRVIMLILDHKYPKIKDPITRLLIESNELVSIFVKGCQALQSKLNRSQ